VLKQRAGDDFGQRFARHALNHDTILIGKHIVGQKALYPRIGQRASTENEEERAIALRSHLDSVQSHIKGLSAKGYQQRSEIGATCGPRVNDSDYRGQLALYPT